MIKRRKDETITAFTIRAMRNEIIEDCAKVLDDEYPIAAAKVRAIKDKD